MTKLLTIYFTLFTSFQLAAQNNCSCLTEYEFVVDHIETNLPAYTDNVTASNQAEYDVFKQQLKQQITPSITENECLKILIRYVEFFKDNHTAIYSNSQAQVDEKNKKELNQFKQSPLFQSRERIELTKDQLKQYPLDDIRGLYTSDGGSYSVAVIPNSKNGRDYVGVITASESPLWEPSQVKFELIQKDDNLYEGFFYYRNHSVYYFNKVSLKHGILNKNWHKTNVGELVDQSRNRSRELDFKILNDSTTYLRVPTFDGNQFHTINEFYKKAHADIIKRPYLIIDVRDNGGGSDKCVLPLLDYIYTDQIVDDEVVSTYVAPAVIKQYESWVEMFKKDTLNFTPETIAGYEALIDTLKASPYHSFLPMSDEPDTITKTPLDFPRKVGIISNQQCASSCETLLQLSIHSKKTAIYGENSGGYLGYGNVGSIQTPCYNFQLNTTTTRYERGRAFEADGIPPKYYLNNDSDWINQTQDLLYQPSL